jgi:hypothetical protein
LEAKPSPAIWPSVTADYACGSNPPCDRFCDAIKIVKCQQTTSNFLRKGERASLAA